MKDKNLVLMKTLDTKFKQGTSPPDIPPWSAPANYSVLNSLISTYLSLNFVHISGT